jgi:hypothetical protein
LLSRICPLSYAFGSELAIDVFPLHFSRSDDLPLHFFRCFFTGGKAYSVFSHCSEILASASATIKEERVKDHYVDLNRTNLEAINYALIDLLVISLILWWIF